MHNARLGIVAATLISFTSINAQAAEFGLGAGLNSADGGTIFLPIDIRNNFRIEPEISYSENNGNNTYTTSPSTSKFESRQISIGTGIYLLKPIGENFKSYLGGRLGYVSNESSQSAPGINYKIKSDGFFVAPTFGGEYFFIRHFSIGLDVSILYQDLSSESAVSSGPQTSEDSNTLNTTSRAMLRYYF